MIEISSAVYGRSSRNRLDAAREPGVDGARALLESFYFAFNRRDMAVFERVWAQHDLIQLNNPLGGIVRGYDAIAGLYRRVFDGPARVWVELHDIVEFVADDVVTFAGRERGEFQVGDEVVPLTIRTSRVLAWMGPEAGWRQIHHHGSVDDPELLARYQGAIESMARNG